MLSDACFEVAEALNVPGVRPSAVERALNAFADAMDADGETAECNPALLRALRQGRVAVNRGALPPRTFAQMAAAVQRHLDRTDTLTDAQLVRALDEWNQTVRQHARTLLSPGAGAPASELIGIQDVVEVLAQRGGSVYPHVLKTGLTNRFPAASAQEVDTVYERALACYALTVTTMGKVCRVPRD